MKKISTIICFAALFAGKIYAQIPTLTITTTPATNCSSSCDGTANANAQGLPGVTYAWNTTPAQTTATATGLCPGVYTCTVSLSPFGSTSGTGTVNCATAVNEVTVDENISLYPNPSNSFVNLQTDYAMNGSAIIVIRSILGNVVYQESMAVNGYLNRNINISGLPAGIYDLQLVTEARVSRKQFIRD